MNHDPSGIAADLGMDIDDPRTVEAVRRVAEYNRTGDVNDLFPNSTPECVHCFDDGAPVYPHDEHETRAAYVARQEADLIREALAIAKERDR